MNFVAPKMSGAKINERIQLKQEIVYVGRQTDREKNVFVKTEEQIEHQARYERRGADEISHFFAHSHFASRERKSPGFAARLVVCLFY